MCRLKSVYEGISVGESLLKKPQRREMCYSKEKHMEESQGSLFIGLKRSNYVVFAAESREINHKGDVISDDRRKIIVSHEKSLMIGYTGRYDYNAGDIEELLIHILEIKEDVNLICLRIKEMCICLQKELSEGEVLNLHFAQSINGEVYYHTFDLTYEFIDEKAILRPYIMHSGILIHNVFREFPTEEQKDKDAAVIKHRIQKEIDASKNYDDIPSIGGNIRCYALDRKGMVYEL
ncbi:MAG: hypothetical protein ACLSX0_01580 [Anaerostipes caccae]|jgi:hypothetical protein